MGFTTGFRGITTAALIAGTALFAAGTASAVSFTKDSSLATINALTPMANPNPTTTGWQNVTGPSNPAGADQYYHNVTGSIDTFRKDAWEGSGNAGGVYSSVSGNAFATFRSRSPQTGLSLVWGSPDSNLNNQGQALNKITFLYKGNIVDMLRGDDVVAAPPTGPNRQSQALIEITNIGQSGVFDEIRLESNVNAFEFANLKAVPEIDAAAGMGSLAALGAILAFARTRRRHTV